MGTIRPPRQDGTVTLEVTYTNPDGSVSIDTVTLIVLLPKWNVQITEENNDLQIGGWARFSATCDDLNDEQDVPWDCTRDIVWSSSDYQVLPIDYYGQGPVLGSGAHKAVR